jgi:hypothetical protein
MTSLPTLPIWEETPLYQDLNNLKNTLEDSDHKRIISCAMSMIKLALIGALQEEVIIKSLQTERDELKTVIETLRESNIPSVCRLCQRPISLNIRPEGLCNRCWVLY